MRALCTALSCLGNADPGARRREPHAPRSWAMSCPWKFVGAFSSGCVGPSQTDYSLQYLPIGGDLIGGGGYWEQARPYAPLHGGGQTTHPGTQRMRPLDPPGTTALWPRWPVYPTGLKEKKGFHTMWRRQNFDATAGTDCTVF